MTPNIHKKKTTPNYRGHEMERPSISTSHHVVQEESEQLRITSTTSLWSNPAMRFSFDRPETKASHGDSGGGHNPHDTEESSSSIECQLTGCDDDVSEDGENYKCKLQDTRSMFQKARQLLHKNSLYRIAVYLYAERKLVLFFWIHFVSTMIIWAHFALIKFEAQAAKVPEGANRYWWKRLAPPLEFGSMHAILFQLALIPLTMSRFSIASLTDTYLDKIFPLNRVLRMHIHLGYTMIIIVFFATIFFFAFFGLLCSDGEVDFCKKFTSEIMVTGYVILGTLLLIGGTSYFRHVIPYEVFYAVHHLVFVMFCVTIAHTLDVEQRKGRAERSQTFRWFSATLLYYVCDRIAMKLNHTYKTKLVDSSCSRSFRRGRTPPMQGFPQSTSADEDIDDGVNVSSSASAVCTIILKVTRPALFRFKPGQYAFLRISEVDAYTWHPFSIASDPESPILEFYIEVIDCGQSINSKKRRSWTKQLFDLLGGDGDKQGQICRHLSVDIMGPYGTSLARTEDYSHVLALSSGTGIVPVLSLFKQHVSHMLQLQPEAYLEELQQRETKILQMDLAAERRKGSLLNLLISKCCFLQKKTKTTNHRHQSLYEKYHSVSDDGGDCLEATNRSSQTRYDMLNSSLRASFRVLDELSDKQTQENGRKLTKKAGNMRLAAFYATRSIYGVVLLTGLPVLGVSVIGLTISWNTTPVELYIGMVETLQSITVVFQILFAIVATSIWHIGGNGILPYVDVAVCLVAPFADWYWFTVYKDGGILQPQDITTFSLLIGYMTLRLWTNVVMPRHNSWQSRLGCISTATLDRLDVIWTTRSAEQVANVLPTILECWNRLVSVWGLQNALKVCRVSIHVTDPNEDACNMLKDRLVQSSSTTAGRMFCKEAIKFHRVNVAQVIEDHSVDMICNRRKSCSLLAFCGSPELAHEVHCRKISNDMLTAITGNKKHQMDFVSESYGGSKKK